ncbi:GrpB family protein [Cronobacter turicensis]
MAGRQITLEPYNPAWPAQFAEEEKRVRDALGDVALAVHHIGSTSVPGLVAKPVIDMLIEVTGLVELDARNDAMRALGYTPRGEFGISGRRYFIKGEAVRTHHLHAFVAGSEHVNLRRHDVVMQEYAQVKFAAARDSGFQSDIYSELKNDFIARVERQALAQR